MAEEIIKDASFEKAEAMLEGLNERIAEMPKEIDSGMTLLQALRLENLRRWKVIDPAGKKLLRRLMMLISRKTIVSMMKSVMNRGKKDISGRNSVCADEYNTMCEEAEATLGELLLMRAGSAAFSNQYTGQQTHVKRSSSVSQTCMWLSCRVLCGSASQYMVKAEDESITLPLTNEGRANRSQLVTEYYVKTSVLADNASSVSSTEASGPTNDTIFSGEIFGVEDFINGGWWQVESVGPLMCPAVVPTRNNSRMNTIIAESPMLASTSSSNNNNNCIPAMLLERHVEQHPARVSLMALLRVRDETIGVSARFPIANEDGSGSGRREGGLIDVLCCVCMLVPKDAAFVPCGHTFCRSCTKELWKARRACPLCNKLIMQILYLF